MRVVYLAAGSGGMYCGSCMRDNRLAATLIASGRDVTLVPLYTPLRTDEKDVSRGPVYYGGVNVFLQQVFAPLRRGAPRWLDRLLDAPALLNWVGRFSGSTRPSSLGRLTVSVLSGEHGPQRRELDKLIAGLRQLRPHVINLANLMFIGMARRLRAEFGAAIFCTLGGDDVFLDQLPGPHRGVAFDIIRQRAADVDAYVAVTRYYADRAAGHFSLPRERIHVVPMGIVVADFQSPAHPRANSQPFTIGYFARICPEKGLMELAQAFAALRRAGRDVRLRVGGHLSAADRGYFQRVKDHLTKCGLDRHVDFAGEVDRDEKIAFLHAIDVLCVPAPYPEAKGFYVLEAMACGTPVVAPDHGSFPELIHDTGGGLLYDRSDPGGLAAALGRLMDDPASRRALGASAHEAVPRLFSHEQMAQRTWALYEQYAAKRS